MRNAVDDDVIFLGLVEANAYDLPRAREILDRALVARADDFATWTALGYTRLRSGDPQGALDALLRATLLEPRQARAHIYLGIAYWQLGRFEDALKEMRTASVHDPKDPLPGSRFGSSVSISGDVAWVGAPGADEAAGAVYTFVRAGSAWLG